MRKLLNRKTVKQERICPICHEEFTDYNDIVPDHRDPKGMGGDSRDDHPDNMQATHWCVMEEKDQPGWMSDGPSAETLLSTPETTTTFEDSCVSEVCRSCGFTVPSRNAAITTEGNNASP